MRTQPNVTTDLPPQATPLIRSHATEPLPPPLPAQPAPTSDDTLLIQTLRQQVTEYARSNKFLASKVAELSETLSSTSTATTLTASTDPVPLPPLTFSSRLLPSQSECISKRIRRNYLPRVLPPNNRHPTKPVPQGRAGTVSELN
jgi:hypothetical protein